MLYGLIEEKISPVEVSLLEKTLTAPTSYEVGFLGRGLAPPLVLLLKGQPKTDIQNGRTGRRSIPTAATAWYPIPGTLLPYTEPTLRCPATQVSERNLQAGLGVPGLRVALVLPPHCRRLILTMPLRAAKTRIVERGTSQAAFLMPMLPGRRLSLRARFSMASLCMRRKLA